MLCILSAAILLSFYPPSDTIKQACELPGTGAINITKPVDIIPLDNVVYYADDTILGSDIIHNDLSINGDSAHFVASGIYFSGKFSVGNPVVGSAHSVGNDLVLGRNYFCDYVSIFFQNTERVHIYNCTFREALKIWEVRAHCLYLDACTFVAGLDLSRIAVDIVVLSNVKTNNIIDLSYLRPNSPESRVLIDLTNSDPAFFKIDFRYSKLDFSICDFDNACSIYTYYIKEATDHGMDITRKILQKDYMEYKAKGLLYMCEIGGPSYFWWDYEVVQYYVWYWAPCVLLMLIIVNAARIKELNNEVYEIEQLTSLINRSAEHSLLGAMYASIIYTSVIFFKVYVSFDKLKYENHSLLAQFIVTYLAGILCLFYLAKYIFNT